MSQQLKLQIMLGAVDKLTAPLKAISRQSSLTAKELAATKKTVRDLEQQSAQVDGYKKLGAQIGVTNAQLKEAQVKFDAIKQTIDASTNPTRMMVNEFNKAEKALGLLTAKQQAMVRSHGEMGQALRDTGVNTKALSAHQRTLKSNLAATNEQLTRQREQLAATAAQQRKLADARAGYQKTQAVRDNLAGTGATGVAAGAAIGAPIYQAVATFSRFEDAMKGIAKQVEGARDANGNHTALYRDMGREIMAIAETHATPGGSADIARLIEGGARMGIKGQEDLLAFARTNAKAAKAFDLPTDQLAEDMGKIANLYQIPIKNIEQLGDTINWLDDNAQSKGSDIIEVMQRMGGVADKLGYKQAAALGSTFLTLGASPEVAASAGNAMVRELSIASMQSKTFANGLSAIGLDAKDVEKRMTTDAMGTILSVLDKIKGLKAEDQLRVATQLFGKEFGDDASKLGNNLDELRRQLALTEDKKAKGSMQRESDADANSLSTQWLLLKAGLDNAQTALGEQLRAPLMAIIGTLKEVVRGVRGWVEANPELAGTLLKVGAALSGIALAFGAVSLAVAALLGPLAMTKMIFSVLGVKFTLLQQALGLLLSPLKLLAGAFLRLGIAIMTTPVGWILAGIAAIAGAVYLIYKHWDTLGPWFKQMWDQIGAFFAGLPAQAMQWGSAIIKSLGDGISQQWEQLKSTLKGYTDWLPDWWQGGNTTVTHTGYGSGQGGLASAGANDGGPQLYQPAKLKPAASSSVVNQPFYQLDIHAAPGMDESRFAKLVVDKFQELERSKQRQQRSSTRDND